MFPEIAGAVWKRNIELVDQPNEPGKFRALCSYQETSMPNSMTLHRNIFSSRDPRAIRARFCSHLQRLMPIL